MFLLFYHKRSAFTSHTHGFFPVKLPENALHAFCPFAHPKGKGGRKMEIWFWYFIIYSFGGFLLEVWFAKMTHAEKRDRKCFLLLPLCPVYGLGAISILALSSILHNHFFLLALAAAFAATASEYLMAIFYEKILGVSFWDYAQLPGNLKGRVCLPFSLCWLGLSAVLVYGVHPYVAALAAQIPAVWLPPTAALLAVDTIVSCYLLGCTHSTDVLKWYCLVFE
ncbi:MAG: putative ABC transporter permease [Intestinimonas sp.]|nr:putative ABC transporter permease [Intestinimonas sp.]